MSTVTIPKSLIQKDDLIIVPRKQYEKLLQAAEQQGILDAELIKALEDVKKGKIEGPFRSIVALKKSLET